MAMVPEAWCPPHMLKLSSCRQLLAESLNINRALPQLFLSSLCPLPTEYACTLTKCSAARVALFSCCIRVSVSFLCCKVAQQRRSTCRPFFVCGVVMAPPYVLCGFTGAQQRPALTSAQRQCKLQHVKLGTGSRECV